MSTCYSIKIRKKLSEEQMNVVKLSHLLVHLVKKELDNDKDNLIYVVFVILFYYLIFLVLT